MVFAGKGRVDDVCMLLSSANDGSTALKWAEQGDQKDAAEIIKKHIKNVNTNSEEEKQQLDMYLASRNPEDIDVILIVTLLRKICVDSKGGAILVFYLGGKI
ncbi:hypothetical protein RJ641_015677 [Dillenia turbinata]|uniref:Uncharacterized protein n=1 Tax=Dillenia turbinata TaxID=194707 RepID=A0AAN8Z3X6_9MAGN